MFALFITHANWLGDIADLVEEIALRLPGYNSAKDALYLIDNQFCHGVHTGGAVDITGLSGEVLALQLHSGVMPLQLVKVVSVGGGWFIVEKTGLGKKAHTCAHRGHSDIVLVLCL